MIDSALLCVSFYPDIRLWCHAKLSGGSKSDPPLFCIHKSINI